MAKDSTEKKSKSSLSTWVRVLIIVAIGIPVLVELLTLFNLVKVRFGEEEDTAKQEMEAAAQPPEVMIGDTLYADQPLTVVMQEMRINVSPSNWEFIIELRKQDPGKPRFGVMIDSLELNSGKMLPQSEETTGWEGEENSDTSEFEGTWIIPNGDIPKTLFVTVNKIFSPDSVTTVHEDVPLGPIPIRYHREEQN